jgi:hypothetical protein
LVFGAVTLAFDGDVFALEVLALGFDGDFFALEVVALVFDGDVFALEVVALVFDVVATVLLAFSGDFPARAFLAGLCARLGPVAVFFAVCLFAVVFALTFFVADFVAIKTRLPEKSKIQYYLTVGYDHFVLKLKYSMI